MTQKMNTILMNFKNSKMSDPHRLILSLKDKIELQRKDKCIALSNLSIYYTWKKNLKSHTITINLKYQLQHGMKNLNLLMGHILYQIFKIIFNIS